MSKGRGKGSQPGGKNPPPGGKNPPSSDDSDDDPNITAESSILDDGNDDPLSREIRAALQELLTETKRNTAALVTGEISEVDEVLAKSSKIFQNVKKSSEAVLDAKIMHSMADIASERTRKMMTDVNNFNIAEFARRVRRGITRSYENDDDDDDDADDDDEETDRKSISKAAWVKFGQSCQMYLRQAPPLAFMYGTFEKGPPPVKLSQKPRTARDTEKEKLITTAPKQLKSFEEMERKETTTIEVDKIHQILRRVYRENGNQPLCYFEFVVNPTSFEQSVENVFYTSFLLKDGLARVSQDDDGLPVIEPIEVNKNRTEASSGESNKTNSYIVSLNRSTWESIVQTFNLRGDGSAPLIPTRPVRHQRLLKRSFQPLNPAEPRITLRPGSGDDPNIPTRINGAGPSGINTHSSGINGAGPSGYSSHNSGMNGAGPSGINSRNSAAANQRDSGPGSSGSDPDSPIPVRSNRSSRRIL